MRAAAAAAAAAAMAISAVSCVLRERAASGTLCVPLHPVSARKFRSVCFLESSTFNPAKASSYLRTDRLHASASYYCKSAYQLNCWLAFRNITFGIVIIRSSIYTSKTSPHSRAQHDHTVIWWEPLQKENTLLCSKHLRSTCLTVHLSVDLSMG